MSKLDLTAVGANAGGFCYVQDKEKGEIRLRRAVVGVRTIKVKGQEDEYETEIRWHLTKFKDREARAYQTRPVVILRGELKDQNGYVADGYWVCRRAGDDFKPLHDHAFDGFNYATTFMNTNFKPNCEHCGCDKRIVDSEVERFGSESALCCEDIAVI